MIPYGRQEITRTDIDAVVNVLKSDFLTQGPQLPKFEQAVASFCHVKHAVAVNSATSALHIACLALGLGVEDWLWTSPITFVASANCALYCGAKVDFVDIDPRTYNMSVGALERKLISAEKTGRLPKIVVPVHLCGQPCDMRGIRALSERFGFKIIEDASHAIGGKYLDREIGSCQFSDITIFSFHPVKIITTAEGGMALTNHDDLNKKMKLLRSHGITRDSQEMTHASEGPWYYQQLELGFNYRMTELQAALGLSQLERLNQYVTRRHELAARYNKMLREMPVVTPWQDPSGYSGLHLYVIRLTPVNKSKHRKVYEELLAHGIGVNLHYIPVHTQPYYQRMGFQPDDYPEAMRYYEEAITLPLYPALTDEMQDNIVSILREVIEA